MSSGASNLSIFYFLFSSRRRHTRSKRDWSSDVCSSDLQVSGYVQEASRRPGNEACQELLACGSQSSGEKRLVFANRVGSQDPLDQQRPQPFPRFFRRHRQLGLLRDRRERPYQPGPINHPDLKCPSRPLRIAVANRGEGGGRRENLAVDRLIENHADVDETRAEIFFAISAQPKRFLHDHGPDEGQVAPHVDSKSIHVARTVYAVLRQGRPGMNQNLREVLASDLGTGDNYRVVLPDFPQHSPDGSRHQQIVVRHQPAVLAERKLDGVIAIPIEPFVRGLFVRSGNLDVTNAWKTLAISADDALGIVGRSAIDDHDFHAGFKLGNDAIQCLRYVIATIQRRYANGKSVRQGIIVR